MSTNMVNKETFPVSLDNPLLLEHRGFIAGSWRTVKDGKAFPVYEPSTGTILHWCSDFSREDFTEAIESAYEGYRAYFETTTAAERANILRTWHSLVQENLNDLARILSLENGKTLQEAQAEIHYASSFILWFAEEAVRSYGDVIPSSNRNRTVFTHKEPVGVCGIITPWNFPSAMITRKIAPALAAGCAVVIKPPSETPFSALALAKLAIQAGIPPSCIHVVPTKDRNASLELVTHPKVRKISFTGSTHVGKMLSGLAAGTLKKVSMELGGNAPFIVFNDADLKKAVEGALACKFRSSGQTCVSANRFFVHESVLEDFTNGLVEKVRSLKLGRGLDDGTTQGPLVNKAAVDKVQSHVQDAISKGAILRTGGRKPRNLQGGYFFEPTVLTNVTQDMVVSSEETFGPLAAISSFSSDKEVIRMANATDLGLAGYFFSESLERVFTVARQLECGMIGVNTGYISAVETPFGGIKESGLGREGSKYGLSEFQNIKSVTIGNLSPST